ncbi:MAG: hypothetical protein ACFFAO_07585, partial [Candidatus Hermodarchaeota archaeon]
RYLNLLCETLIDINRKKIIEYIKLNEKISGVKKEIPSDETQLKDNSNIWRPTIKSYGVRNEKNIITDEILSLLEKFMDIDQVLFIKCLKGLSKYHSSIFKRIQLHFYILDPETFKDEIKEVLNDKDIILDRDYWNEVFFILKNNYESSEESVKKKILEWIEEDYEIDLSHMELNEEEEKKWKIQIKEDRKQRLLEPILEYLDEDYKEEQKKLINKITDTETPKPAVEIGPVRIFSPLDNLKNQISNKNIDEIILFLSEYTPDESKIFSESRQDLGIALSRLIEQNPSEFLELLEKIYQIPKVFISFILEGFSYANKEKKKFNYKAILEKLELLIQISNSEETLEYKIKLSLLEYIEYCIRRDDFDFSKVDKEKMLEFVDNCALQQEKNIESYDNIRNDLEEKVFYYYDTIKGKAIENLLLYAAENKKNHPLNAGLQLKINSIFDKLLEQEGTQAELIRAKFASNLLNLFYIDEEWTKKNIDKIFPREDRILWRIAWESYITVYKNNLNEKAYEILVDNYLMAVNKITSPNLSYSALEGLSSHLLLAYIYGNDNLSERSKLNSFYKQANPIIKQRAMWYCCIKILEGIKNNQELNEKGLLYDRILELWKFRIENTKDSKPEDIIKEFAWYSRFFSEMEQISEKYLDVFLEVLKKIDGYIGVYAKDIFDRLKSYIPIFKNKVLDLLILICKSKHKDWLYTHTAQTINELLEDSIKEDNSGEIQDKIIQIADLMVKKGYFEFERFYKIKSNNNTKIE